MPIYSDWLMYDPMNGNLPANYCPGGLTHHRASGHILPTMCGRFAITSDSAVLARHFDLPSVADKLPARYNIAPTQDAPVIRLTTSGMRRLDLVRWGLIPHWARDPSMGVRLINARAETVQSKPAFRDAFRQRRCLVLANGFYEWKRTDAGNQPYWIRPDNDQPLAFAGLWERWWSHEGVPRDTFAIITTEANALVAQIHGRMPVIIDPKHYATWLARNEPGLHEMLSLLRPARTEGMEAVPVDKHVNSPTNDDPRCVQPTGPVLRVSDKNPGRS